MDHARRWAVCLKSLIAESGSASARSVQPHCIMQPTWKTGLLGFLTVASAAAIEAPMLVACTENPRSEPTGAAHSELKQGEHGMITEAACWGTGLHPVFCRRVGN